jgi:hypothetical protein
MFEESGIVPQIRQVDPFATPTEIDIVNLSMSTDSDNLTDEEKRDLFAANTVVKYVSKVAHLNRLKFN